MAPDIIERWKASAIASALSTALTIYPCHIRVHRHWQSKLQLPTARKKEWRPATADSSPQAVTCHHMATVGVKGLNTVFITRNKLIIIKWHSYVTARTCCMMMPGMRRKMLMTAVTARSEDVVQYAPVKLQSYFTKQSFVTDAGPNHHRTRRNARIRDPYTTCLANFCFFLMHKP